MNLSPKNKLDRSNSCFQHATLWSIVCSLFFGMLTLASAQQPESLPKLPIGDGPYVFDSAEAGPIRVDVITKDLSHPWGMAFLPGGDILVTEGPGELRLIRDGVLDPQSISGVPEVLIGGIAGQALQEVTLHPNFEENNLVYLTYMKPLEGDDFTAAVARGRLNIDQMALDDVEDIFIATTQEAGFIVAAPMVFLPDGTILMAVGGAPGDGIAQNPGMHNGKMIRVHDDGSVPIDNPFVNETGFLPEIYSIGHRNMLGLAINPVTGEIWESENGPQGGDEINILKPGANYGWPMVSFGRQYDGPRVSENTYMEGTESPIIIWVPSIAASGMIFYTGDRFPAWQNNLLIGGLMFARIGGTGLVERIVFNENWDEIRRERMLTELRQRVRNIEQGPDGLIYVLLDSDDGALLRIAPE